MTYEELKNKFEELTQVSIDLKDTGNYMVLEESGTLLLAFNKNSGYERHFHINTMPLHPLLNLYDKDNYITMWEIIFNLIDTPADERFPEQKYYVKLDLPDIFDKSSYYLNKHSTSGRVIGYWFGGMQEFSYKGETYKTKFTMSEIKELIPEDDLCKFELIPVEEYK